MNDRQLIADLLSALEYHTEQTRPIQFSKVAIEAAREYLRKPAQQPEQHTEPCGWRMKYNGGWAYSFTKDAWNFIYAVSPAARKAARDNAPAQQQEPFALLVRKHSWNKGQYECAPPNAPEYGRQWADERVWVYTSPPVSKPFDTHAAPGQSFDTHSRTPQQEPVAWMWRCKPYCGWPEWSVSLKRPADSGRDGHKRTEGYEDVPLYTSPQPSKPWVGLTAEEIEELLGFNQYTAQSTKMTLTCVAQAIEAKLREKNA